MHGQGTLTWPDGRCYKGVFDDLIRVRNSKTTRNMAEVSFYFQMVKDFMVSGMKVF